jgi:hypothetical protein
VSSPGRGPGPAGRRAPARGRAAPAQRMSPGDTPPARREVLALRVGAGAHRRRVRAFMDAHRREVGAERPFQLRPHRIGQRLAATRWRRRLRRPAGLGAPLHLHRRGLGRRQIHGERSLAHARSTRAARLLNRRSRRTSPRLLIAHASPAMFSVGDGTGKSSRTSAGGRPETSEHRRAGRSDPALKPLRYLGLNPK